MMEEAIRLALAGAQFDEAAHLIESVAGDMLRRGSSASLTWWLDTLPEETVRARPRLCLARGWTFVWGSTFHLESADEWAQLALQTAEPAGSLDRELAGEVCALQAIIDAIRGEVARSGVFARQALNDLPSDSKWRGVINFILGTAYFYSDYLVAATPILEEAIRLSQADGVRYIQLIAAAFLADIQVIQGRLNRAMETYQQVLDWAAPSLPEKGAVMAHGGIANILCERNQLDAALLHTQLGVEQLEKVGGPAAALWIYRSIARVHFAQGNFTDALSVLNRAFQNGQNTQVRFVMAQAAALRARVQLAQGDLGAATLWMANSGLSPDDPEANHPGLRETEYLSLARVFNAEGRHIEALSLLERLLESAQAEGRSGSAIGLLAVQAWVHQAQGNRIRALESLEHSLTLAEPEGYIRIFVDEGERMRLLLLDYQSFIKKKISNDVDAESIRLLTYTDRLLEAFPQPASSGKPKSESLPDPLSERELDILRLIAAGRSNQEIADMLVIAVSTVKSHINNLYGKLGTNRRTEAITIAREQGLLMDRPGS
jgi:LuxR family maltose regulon positive regulatory protein